MSDVETGEGEAEAPSPPEPMSLRVSAARSSIRTRIFGTKEEAPRIGRFQILRQVGAGGMGTVFAAYDEKLERKVAVKVLWRKVERRSQARLLREARSMARLRHPNVVQIYEVGEHGNESYIAMEFVDGQSLRDWQAHRDRSWRAIVDAYAQAGRGLAAAHAVGLVHRDFKPPNAMVELDADGHAAVRVLDFGLARRSAHGASAAGQPGAPAGALGEAPKESLTTTGTAVGTPAYMAPEQILGEPVDARTDQFALCVALWEALHREHPFASESVEGMFARVVAGERLPARNPEVPRRVVAALERGLKRDPAARWPSMSALVEELVHQPAGRRNRWLLGIGSLAIIGVVAGVTIAHRQRAELCTGAAAQLAGVWDQGRRAEVRAALLATEVPYAETTSRRTIEVLDEYTEDWKAMHVEVCEATTLRGEQSAEVMQVRMGCLHRAKTDLVATTAVLAGADLEVVENAASVVAGLSALDRCTDLRALAQEVEPPLAGEASAVADIKARLARARAEAAAGRYDRGQQIVRDVVEQAAALEYGPIRAEIALTKGLVLAVPGSHGGDLQSAELEPSLREALQLSLLWGEWESAHRAATLLIELVGGRWFRVDEALRYREVAQGLVRGDPRRQALTRSALGQVLGAQNKHEEALAEFRGALEILEQVEDSQTAPLHSLIGQSLLRLGRCEDAEVEARRALALQQALLGSEHPGTSLLRNRLGSTLVCQSRYVEAEAVHREALESLVRGLGPEDLSVTGTRFHLGAALGYQRRFAEAEAEFRQVITVHEARLRAKHRESAAVLRLIDQGDYAAADAEDLHTRSTFAKTVKDEYGVLGGAHLNIAETLRYRGKFSEAEAEHRKELALLQRSELEPVMEASVREFIGYCLLMQGRDDEAELEYRRALTILQRESGPEDSSVARVRTSVGDALHRQGKYPEAEAEYRLALATWSTRDAPQDLRSGVEARIAMVLVKRGRVEQARPMAEHAWARMEAEPPSVYRALSAFAVAGVRWEARGEAAGREHARGLAQQALEYFADDVQLSLLETEVRAWLEAHPAAP